jgi:hypothetical protein
MRQIGAHDLGAIRINPVPWPVPELQETRTGIGNRRSANLDVLGIAREPVSPIRAASLGYSTASAACRITSATSSGFVIGSM